jgi:hypothetical protein
MKAVQRAAEKATNNNGKDKSCSIAVLSDPNNPDRVRTGNRKRAPTAIPSREDVIEPADP